MTPPSIAPAPEGSPELAAKASKAADSRASRFRRGALATLLSQAITAFGQLATVPIFLAFWGDALYGEWLVLTALAAQMAIFDMGLQTYVVNRLCQSYARKDLDQYARILHSALAGSMLISAAALALVVVLALLTPINTWFQLELVPASVAKAVAILLALQILVAIPSGILRGVYRTLNRYPTGVMLHNVQRIAHFGLTIAAVVLTKNLAFVAAAQLVPVVAVLLYARRDIARNHPEVSLGIARADKALALSFLGPSSLFFLLQIAQAGSIQGSTIILAAMTGSASVTLYVSLRTLCNVVRQAVAAFAHTLWPELTSIEATGDYRKLRALHLLAVKGLTALSLGAAFFIYFGCEDLLQLWTGGRLAGNDQLTAALLAFLVLQTPWWTSSMVLVASNRHRPVAIATLGATLLGLALGAILLPRLGIIGLPIGLAIADQLVCGWFIPMHVCALLRERFWRLTQQVVLRGIPTAALGFGACIALSQLLPALHAWRLPALALTVALTITATTLVTWLSASERRHIFAMLKR